MKVTNKTLNEYADIINKWFGTNYNIGYCKSYAESYYVFSDFKSLNVLYHKCKTKKEMLTYLIGIRNSLLYFEYINKQNKQLNK